MRVSTLLWFDGRAQEAAEVYTGLFEDAGILDLGRDPDGRVTTVTFELAGQCFVAYDGDTPLPFTPAVAPYVECDDQDSLDTLWAGLTDGGEEGPGGSLTDRFGITWHVLPTALAELLGRGDAAASERVLTALHAMTKVDVQALVDAHRGGSRP